jgi:hypothetical protein
VLSLGDLKPGLRVRGLLPGREVLLEEVRQAKEGIGSEYLRVTFNAKEAPDAEFIAPGHALFEAVLQRTLRDATPAMQQGASFALPQATVPGLLAHFELTVRDGTGAVVSKRLVGCLEGAEIRSIPARVLVDATPGEPPEAPGDTGEAKERLLTWVHDHVLDDYLSEVMETRQREVAIRRKYATRSLQHLLRESTRKLTQYKVKQRGGEDMGLAILREERRQAQLEERLATLEERLAQEESLNPEPAELLALAYVQPPAVTEALDEDDPRLRWQVELAAMQVALEYERQRGQEPQDVSAANVGYDIESPDRAVEVKGRAGSGAVVLTPNEWIVAGRLEELYYLYIVTDALTSPKLHIISDPVNNLSAVEEVGVVRHVVPQASWRAAAEEA